MAKYLQYYVEGECEKKLISAFQHVEEGGFKIGKIEIINPATKEITKLRIAQLKNDTAVALVYDVDYINEKILERNIANLRSNKNVKEIYHIQSINNFEDEIKYSTKVKNINDIFSTKSSNEFKNKFISHPDIVHKLRNIDFSIKLIWSRNTDKCKFLNQGDKIKHEIK